MAPFKQLLTAFRTALSPLNHVSTRLTDLMSRAYPILRFQHDEEGSGRRMSRLSEAQDKLEVALARLEKISGEQALSANEAATARAAEIELMSTRCDVLEDKARVVSERLNAAIGRVQTLLES